MNNNQLYVTSEIGRLRKILIHSPDGGIGKIIPSKFKDWLYDDTVHLTRMQNEYDEYVKLLLYFLDPEKIDFIENSSKTKSGRPRCFIPSTKEYFDSDKVLDVQTLLAHILEDEHIRTRLVASICAIEQCSMRVVDLLLDEKRINSRVLANVFITGILEQNGQTEFLFPPTPNLIFTRDIAITVHNHLLLTKLSKTARIRESLLAKYITYYNLLKNDSSKVLEVLDEGDLFLYEEYEQKDMIVTAEGGDIMMIAPNHLLVGCSERTSPNGANEVVHTIFKNQTLGIEKVTVIKIPQLRAHMHIDTIFTQVSRNIWVMYGGYSDTLSNEKDYQKKRYFDGSGGIYEPEDQDGLEVFQFYKPRDERYDASKDYRLKSNDYKRNEVQTKFGNKMPEDLESLLRQISIHDFLSNENDVRFIYSADGIFPYDEREQWTDSCNVLALKEGVVIGYDRNEKTAEAFTKQGFNVMTTQQIFRELESGNCTPDTIEKTLIVLPSAELSRGRGGSHCMSMPLLRDTILV